ncbi:hypothetical protein BCR42DRAFT_407149 [Absidia repens]|uniref:Ser-Thr-rich glycosyl-phosphatidyl-inositol-anchored membrane family-domain-containing protein n=1 Tax=Absidia repens TaxID=90262 RepID=A0A1X2ITF8_9FUNG|nr:hypothetical protein BCR42DRAFT_407149 [Absidia repens]
MISSNLYVFLLVLCILIQATFGYLSEPHPPFVITSPTQDTTIKRGDSLNVTWQLTPGVRYPIYGYAAASTTQTIIGLLSPDARRDERYIYKVDSNIKLSDHNYAWTVDEQTEPGDYRIGIGFYYNEASPIIHII